MARVKYKKTRTKRVRPPRPLPPPKPVRPRRSVLKSIYKELLTSDTDQRVTALAKAMEWYDHCLAYVIYKQKGKWSLPQLKEKNAAERSRTAGITTIHSHQKEKSFTQAVTSYECIVKDFKPPLISKFLTKLNEQKETLENRKKKLGNKFGEFLKLLQSALQPKNVDDKLVTLRVDKINANYRIDAEGNVTLDRKVVLNLRKVSRKHGLLSGVLQVLPILSESAARTAEVDSKGFKTGRMLLSNGKRYRSVLEMLNSLNRYCLTDDSPRKLTRKPKPKKEKPE